MEKDHLRGTERLPSPDCWERMRKERVKMPEKGKDPNKK